MDTEEHGLGRISPVTQRVNGSTPDSRFHLYYNDEIPRTAGKNLECGDLSPLLPLWRLVAKAGTRPAARKSCTPSRIRRRQVACRKRGQVRALQRGCGFAALRPFVSIRGLEFWRIFQLPGPG